MFVLSDLKLLLWFDLDRLVLLLFLLSIGTTIATICLLLHTLTFL